MNEIESKAELQSRSFFFTTTTTTTTKISHRFMKCLRERGGNRMLDDFYLGGMRCCISYQTNGKTD